MALQRMLLDITPSKFPFRARTVEHQVLAPGRSGLFGDSADATPSAAWLENFWALSAGQQAAIVAEYGAIEDLPAEVIAQFGASRVVAPRIFRTDSGASLAVITDTQVWLYSIGGWVKVMDSPVVVQTSTCVLKGETYLHQFGGNLHKVSAPTEADPAFSQIEEVITTGILFDEIISVCAAISYLVATDGTSVYWSAPLDPTYWAPDGVGPQFGAGATKILAVSGAIRFLLPTVDGFYVLTDSNVVYARYSGDAENPWVFTEVANSSGTVSHWAVTSSTNMAAAFVWCDNGLASISGGQATYGFPELTEFLSGSVLESFNSMVNEIESTMNATLDFQLSFLGGRFLTISYGELEQVREYILIFDTLVQRWSRIAIDHVAVLDIRQDAADQGITFENWTDTFENTLYTFSEMGGASASSDVKAITIGVICADGKIKRLSPVDLHTLDNFPQDYVDLTFEVLPNIMHFAALKATRNREISLNEVTCFYTYPAFPTDGDPDTENTQYSTVDTEIEGYSQEDPTIRSYLLSHARSNEEFYVERVRGTRLALTLKRTSSLQGLEIGFTITAVRRI